MGIDLYIYRVAKQNAINDLKMLNENSDNVLEIAYFKNDTKLKEWFEAQYIFKGGLQKKFSDVYLRLTVEDLQEIEEEFIMKTRIFSEPLYNFIMDSRKFIEKGYEIYMYSFIS